MKTKMPTRILSIGCIVAMSWFTACQEEDRLNVQDAQDINEEAMTDSYFKDIDDMGNVAANSATDDQYNNAGKRAQSYELTVTDTRFCSGSVVITLTPSGTVDAPEGDIVIDFGTTGCEDIYGNVRTGKLKYHYQGKRFRNGSSVVVTPENYKINGTLLEGTRTSTYVGTSQADTLKFNVTLANGKATFLDGATATRTSDITWKWVQGATRAQDQLIVYAGSEASGTTRGGRAYTVDVLDNLLYERTCFIATDGVKKYTVNSQKEITIDYGTGDCREVSVTVNGVTRSLRVN